MKKTLLLAVPLLLGACAKTITDPAAVRYEGFYTWGFEASGFTPCGSTESWWVTEDAGLQTRYADVATADYQPVYVEIAGEVGPEGEFGHLGAYDREIAVKEVFEMRTAREDDCR